MNEDEFRECAQEMTDYILDYLKFLPGRPVAPKVSPGFLTEQLPEEPPQKGEPLRAILEEVEKHLMPGMVHWEHPRFFAYFPASHSFPSTLAEMVADSVGVSRFEWNLSPAVAELEHIVTDWYGRLMGLPEKFLRYGKDSLGGGIVLSSSSECVFAALIKAREECLQRLADDEDRRSVRR